MVENKQFLLDYFYEEFTGTEWLLQKDSVYADNYSNLLTTIEQSTAADEDLFWELEAQMQSLKSIYFERAKDPSAWVAPKKKAANELVHNEDGSLTQESVELLHTAISDKNGEKTLISDTGKTISFGE